MAKLTIMNRTEPCLAIGEGFVPADLFLCRRNNLQIKVVRFIAPYFVHSARIPYQYRESD